MSKAISFLAGLGTGYFNHKAKQEKDAQDKEERELRRQEAQLRLDALKQDAADRRILRDAGAERQGVSGTSVAASTGTNFYTDPAQAQAAADEARIEDEMRGADPAKVSAQPATGVVAQGGTQGHQIVPGQADTAAMNTPEARSKRVLAAQWGINPTQALATEANMLDVQAKRIGLSEMQAKAADAAYNRHVDSMFNSSPDWTQGAAKLLNDSQMGGLAGMAVAPRITADGKSVEFVGTKEGGQPVVLAAVPNSDAGRAQVMQRFMRADLATKVGFMFEQHKMQQEQANKDRDFDLRKSGQETDQQYRQRVLGIQASQEARAREVHAATQGSSKIPAAVKEQASTLAKQMESVGNALNKAMAEGQFDPENPGTKQLLESQAALRLKYAQVLKPYMPSAEGNADPLGLNAPAGEKPAATNVATKPTPAPAAAAGTTAPASQRAAAPSAPPATPSDAARTGADEADAALKAAIAHARTFGLKKRRDDPQGYADALQAVERARADAASAQSAYEAALPASATRAFPR